MSFDSRYYNFRQKLETGFMMVSIVFLVILSLSVILYIADMESRLSGRPNEFRDLLCASWQTPWGIVTSFFVHANEPHLTRNMIALLIFLVLFVTLNVFYTKKEMKRRILFSSIIIFIIPIISNLISIIVYPKVIIIGSSGIVYSLEGLCFTLSIINFMGLKHKTRQLTNETSVVLAASLINIIVCTMFIYNLIFFPELFLGSRNSIVIGVHALSFCGGCLSALFYSTKLQSPRIPILN